MQTRSAVTYKGNGTGFARWMHLNFGFSFTSDGLWWEDSRGSTHLTVWGKVMGSAWQESKRWLVVVIGMAVVALVGWMLR